VVAGDSGASVVPAPDVGASVVGDSAVAASVVESVETAPDEAEAAPPAEAAPVVVVAAALASASALAFAAALASASALASAAALASASALAFAAALASASALARIIRRRKPPGPQVSAAACGRFTQAKGHWKLAQVGSEQQCSRVQPDVGHSNSCAFGRPFQGATHVNAEHNCLVVVGAGVVVGCKQQCSRVQPPSAMQTMFADSKRFTHGIGQV